MCCTSRREAPQLFCLSTDKLWLCSAVRENGGAFFADVLSLSLLFLGSILFFFTHFLCANQIYPYICGVIRHETLL